MPTYRDYLTLVLETPTASEREWKREKERQERAEQRMAARIAKYHREHPEEGVTQP